MSDSVDHIIEATIAISRHLRQKMACEPESHANMIQMHALGILREREGMTMKQLADHLKITSPSATSFVNRLVKLGWVERQADPSNRKLVRLKVSKAGAQMLQKKMSEKKKELQQMLSVLSSQDQKEFARILTTLASTLQSHS